MPSRKVEALRQDLSNLKIESNTWKGFHLSSCVTSYITWWSLVSSGASLAPAEE
jgi:hypothetical protein